MCHTSVLVFAVYRLKREWVQGQRVLEVGSYNVNGSVRPYVEALEPASYLGMDLRSGPGVDVIGDVSIPGLMYRTTAPFGLIIGTEVLEHVEDWRAAVTNFKECLWPGGHLLVTTRSQGFPLHEFPGDFWRYEVEDMKAIFADHEIRILESDPEAPGVLMLVRSPNPPIQSVDLRDIKLLSMSTGVREGQARV